MQVSLAFCLPLVRRPGQDSEDTVPAHAEKLLYFGSKGRTVHSSQKHIYFLFRACTLPQALRMLLRKQLFKGEKRAGVKV